MKIAVVGSGPSGWAATKKLLELGHDISVLDTGLIEEDALNIRKNHSDGLSKKLYFGSELPYWNYPSGPGTKKIKVNPISSFAKGGLSLVWGATMLPYCEADTMNWPFSISRLEPDFVEISRLIPISGNDDQLSAAYGRFISRRGIIPSQRILRFLECSQRNPQDGVLVGLSRLAVETGSNNTNGCIYCNKCLDGCPNNFIWNSEKIDVKAKYSKMRVTKVVEVNNMVRVEGLGIDGAAIDALEYDRVFLACGPVETFRILANSGIVGGKAIMKDSSTFFVPLLVRPKLGNVKSNSFALSQCFIRLNSESEKPTSQFQIYEYSNELISRARKSLPLGFMIPNWVLSFFLKRMMVAIGYLEGDRSPSIQMQYLAEGSVELSDSDVGLSFKERNQSIKRSIISLGKFTSKKGLIPLKLFAQIAPPGEGVHFGAWLPMGEKTDLLGRPLNTKNIHVIDSSILPSIAPGPITYTIMANAMRIARESVK
jgi:choline dehydrogenase-like flavoprotein